MDWCFWFICQGCLQTIERTRNGHERIQRFINDPWTQQVKIQTGRKWPPQYTLDRKFIWFLDTSQLPPGLVVCVSEHSPLWPMLLVLSVQELVSYFYIFMELFLTRLWTIIFRYPFGCHHHLSVLWNFRQGTTRIRWHGWHAVLNSDWLTDISRFLRNGANSSSSRLRLDKL